MDYSSDLGFLNRIMTDTINAHGGQLLNLYVDSENLQAEKDKTQQGKSWDLSKRQLCDVELLLNGAFSPLDGFLTQKDYESVLSSMRLGDGTLWPMPITLDVSESFAKSIEIGEMIALRDAEGVLIANMTISDCWKADKLKEAEAVFSMTDISHPGVDYVLHEAKEYYLGGKLTGVTPPFHYDFQELRHSPQQLRDYFQQLQWSKVIAFQTRNPVHRAHVIMTKRLMAEHQANLVIHSAVGVTKPGDIDHYSRVRCYKKILSHYPENSAVLSLFPLAMKMAGPREALW